MTWLPDPRHFKLVPDALLLDIGLRLARDLLFTMGQYIVGFFGI